MVLETAGLVLGLAAALAWGVRDLAGTIVSRQLGGPLTAAVSGLVSFSVIAVVVAMSAAVLPAESNLVPASIGAGLIAAIAYLSFYAALAYGPISVVTPIVSLYGGLTVVLSLALLGERPTTAQALGAATATVGVVLVGARFQADQHRLRLVGPGALLALVTVVAWGFFTIVISEPMRTNGWLHVLLLSRATSVGVIWLVVGLRHARGPRSAPAWLSSRQAVHTAIVGAVVVGLLEVSGSFLWAAGLHVAPTWLVGLAGSLEPAVAIVAGVVLLKERPRAIQWAGFGVVIASLALLAL